MQSSVCPLGGAVSCVFVMLKWFIRSPFLKTFLHDWVLFHVLQSNVSAFFHVVTKVYWITSVTWVEVESQQKHIYSLFSNLLKVRAVLNWEDQEFRHADASLAVCDFIKVSVLCVNVEMNNKSLSLMFEYQHIPQLYSENTCDVHINPPTSAPPTDHPSLNCSTVSPAPCPT